MKINIGFLPQDIKTLDLAETVCIVLDIFRATTSIVTAMNNGCASMIPVVSTEEASSVGQQTGANLFAGERQSIRIEGYQFGNSPLEFSQDKVQGHTIIMTTTNGTVAIKATEGSYRTLIGSFINARAVCQRAMQYDKDILIVCAGTDGYFSLEDALCAGLLVDRLSEKNDVQLTDSAHGAMLIYKGAKEELVATATQSRNGKRLVDLQRMEDIEYCFQIDLLDVVPEYKEGRIIIK